MSEPVIVTRDGGVATITVNRPQVYNALDPAMATGLRGAVKSVANDDSVRCVVLTGAGEAFMSGGDVTYFQDMLSSFQREGDATLTPLFDQVHPTIRGILEMPKPVVASVRGAVAGIGMSLMLACDLVIAAESSTFTLAYIRIGTSPDGGSTLTLPATIGLKRAMEMALLGDRFGCREAREMGLINRVVPDADHETATCSLAGRLAMGPCQAMARTKAMLNRMVLDRLASQFEGEQEAFTRCTRGAEFEEGVTAFVEHREPRFGT